MKKTGLLVLCLFCVVVSFGQEQEVKQEAKKEKQQRLLATPILFKDRIVLDFFSSIWMGVNSEIKQKAINFGFNGAIMFDLPVKKNNPFSFGLGLGVSNHNMYSNAIWGIGDEYTTIMTPVPESIKYRRNKITFTNINIPLEFRYRHHLSGFKISVGVRVGLMADIHSKYFGAALDGRDDKDLFKNYNILNRTKVPVEFTFKTGWKFVSVNVSYMITKMFTSEGGPQIHPISFGITLCPY
ncbi:MAG: PorT family protein [Bacteroidales bacterium]|jgi:hypothetical protein|nr:PorT family protein [Bacteroidales bacterium]